MPPPRPPPFAATWSGFLQGPSSRTAKTLHWTSVPSPLVPNVSAKISARVHVGRDLRGLGPAPGQDSETEGPRWLTGPAGPSCLPNSPHLHPHPNFSSGDSPSLRSLMTFYKDKCLFLIDVATSPHV